MLTFLLKQAQRRMLKLILVQVDRLFERDGSVKTARQPAATVVMKPAIVSIAIDAWPEQHEHGPPLVEVTHYLLILFGTQRWHIGEDDGCAGPRQDRQG